MVGANPQTTMPNDCSSQVVFITLHLQMNLGIQAAESIAMSCCSTCPNTPQSHPDVAQNTTPAVHINSKAGITELTAGDSGLAWLRSIYVGG